MVENAESVILSAVKSNCLGFAVSMCTCACDPSVSEITVTCGLDCSQVGISNGNSHISGLAEFDAFFGAVVDLDAAADSVGDGVETELAAIGASVGAPPGSTGAQIAGRVESLLAATLQDGLAVTHAPVTCEASVEAAARATAECDAAVGLDDLGTECLGSCVVEAAVEDCGPEAELRCTGVAPDLLCPGTCTGTCHVDPPTECAGECQGTCLGGVCTVVDDQGDCAGQCTGTCQGECRLPGGGECGGTCLGTCEIAASGQGCGASMEARCSSTGPNPVACAGVCEGVAGASMVAAACEAVVDAKARAAAHCVPPPLSIGYQWRDGLDPSDRAEFRAWLAGFELRLRSLVAAEEKAGRLLVGLEELAAAADREVRGTAEQVLTIADEVDELVSVSCAIIQLDDAVAVLEDVRSRLAARRQAALEVMAVVNLSQVADARQSRAWRGGG